MNTELINEIIELLPNDTFMEDSDGIIIDNVKYGWSIIEELTTEDEGKYQYGGFIYGIGVLDENNVVGKPLFYVEQDFTQTGSYYSFQERMFNKPYVVEKKEVLTYEWTRLK